MTGGLRAVAGAALALVLVAGCVPRPVAVAPLAGGGRAERYLSQLVRREQRAGMVEGVATLWPRAFAPCDTCPPRRLPALQAGFVVAGPDGLRLRVESAFGTALDLGLVGDSITAWVPSQRWAVELDAARDSLGLGQPGRIATRVLCAGWRPPAEAWSAGVPEGGALVLRWSEDADSVALAVDEAGVPAWARLWRGPRRGVVVHYGRWESTDGSAWPTQLEVRDLGGAFELTCRLDRVSFPARADRSRLAVRIPDGAERLGLDRLRGLLERVGAPR
jgi:hypothetical protein